MKNLLLEKVEYKIERTNFGVWHRFLYPNGACFAEFKSHAIFFRLPLLHYTRGKCPETGKRVVAKGVVAVGRLAMGILAIGELGLGLLFGLRARGYWTLCDWSSCNWFDVWFRSDSNRGNSYWTACLRKLCIGPGRLW